MGMKSIKEKVTKEVYDLKIQEMGTELASALYEINTGDETSPEENNFTSVKKITDILKSANLITPEHQRVVLDAAAELEKRGIRHEVTSQFTPLSKDIERAIDASPELLPIGKGFIMAYDAAIKIKPTPSQEELFQFACYFGGVVERRRSPLGGVKMPPNDLMMEFLKDILTNKENK